LELGGWADFSLSAPSKLHAWLDNIGRPIRYLQATFSMDGVMGLLLLLALLGLGVTAVMNKLERALLAWQ
jgi:hypothetical protein